MLPSHSRADYVIRVSCAVDRTITSQDFPVSTTNQRDRFLTTRVRRSTVVIVFAVSNASSWQSICYIERLLTTLSIRFLQGVIWLTNWLITLVVIAQTALIFVWKQEMAESIVSRVASALTWLMI